jgi:hypothetical protein
MRGPLVPILDMQIEVLVFTLSLLSPLSIFLFGRQLLDKKTSWTTLIIISTTLAILGILLTVLDIGKNHMYAALVVPLYSISIYRPLYLYFVHRKNRQPIDTAMDWRPNLLHDRLFNIVYLILVTSVPIFGIAVIMAM